MGYEGTVIPIGCVPVAGVPGKIVSLRILRRQAAQRRYVTGALGAPAR
jgi:hypothetical protein